MTTGRKEDWVAFQNNDIACERLIGQVKETTNKKKICDTTNVDNEIKEYTSINHAFYLNV